MSLGVDVFSIVVIGYTIPGILPLDLDGKKIFQNNAKAKNVIIATLSESELIKVMHCKSAKVWDKLENNYGGDKKVKKAKAPNL